MRRGHRLARQTLLMRQVGAAIALAAALTPLAPATAPASSARCKTVVKKIHGKKRRVRVCPKPKPKPPPPSPAAPALPGIEVPPTGARPWPGTAPSELATSRDALWVGAHRAGEIYRVDPQTNNVVATVAFPGSAAGGLAVTDVAVWVGQCKFGTTGLWRVDTATNRVTAAIAGPTACGVAAAGNTVWATDTLHDGVWRIDAMTNTVVAKIALAAGSLPERIVTAFGSVWVVSAGNGTLARIDPTTDTVAATIRVGAANGSDPNTAAGAESITAGGGAIWVGNDVDNKLYKVDPGTNTAAALDIGAEDRGNWRTLGVSFGMGSVWARTRACEAAQVDPGSGSVIKRIPLCQGTSEETAGIEAAFDSLWVTYPESGHVRRLTP